MTTVPGHNQMLPQSGIAQELSHQAHTLKPSPDQAAAQQQAQEVIRNSSVQGSEEAERLKKEKEKKEVRQRQKIGRKEKNKINQEEDLALDPDASGRLLDTRV